MSLATILIDQIVVPEVIAAIRRIRERGNTNPTDKEVIAELNANIELGDAIAAAYLERTKPQP